MRYNIELDPERPRCQLLQVYFDQSDFEIWEDQFLGYNAHDIPYHWAEHKCRILHPFINNLENDLIVEIHDQYFYLHKTVHILSPRLHPRSYDECVDCVICCQIRRWRSLRHALLH